MVPQLGTDTNRACDFEISQTSSKLPNFNFNLKSFIDTKLYRSMVKAKKTEQEENAKINSTGSD